MEDHLRAERGGRGGLDEGASDRDVLRDTRLSLRLPLDGERRWTVDRGTGVTALLDHSGLARWVRARARTTTNRLRCYHSLVPSDDKETSEPPAPLPPRVEKALAEARESA